MSSLDNIFNPDTMYYENTRTRAQVPTIGAIIARGGHGTVSTPRHHHRELLFTKDQYRPRAKPRTGRGGVAWNLKACTSAQILNPRTGICVKKEGAIGRALLAGQTPKKRARTPTPVNKLKPCPPGSTRHSETRRCRKN